MNRRVRRIGVVLPALALLAGACGDDDDSGDDHRSACSDDGPDDSRDDRSDDARHDSSDDGGHHGGDDGGHDSGDNGGPVRRHADQVDVHLCQEQPGLLPAGDVHRSAGSRRCDQRRRRHQRSPVGTDRMRLESRSEPGASELSSIRRSARVSRPSSARASSSRRSRRSRKPTSRSSAPRESHPTS